MRTLTDRNLDLAEGRIEELRAVVRDLTTVLEKRNAENAKLREAVRIARLHAPSIRLAPERRYTIKVLDEALADIK